MNIKSLLEFVYKHSDLIFGSTLALFFITIMLLIIRAIGSKEDSVPHGQASVDVDTLETAMKRVLETHQLAAPVVQSSGHSSIIDVDDLSGDEGAIEEGSSAAGASKKAAASKASGSAASSDKDQQIQKLTQELEKAQAAVKAAPKGNDNAEMLAEYNRKIEELQARLAEYEIIEDDIADLSLFREENERLKSEIEELKKGKVVVTGQDGGPRTLADESSEDDATVGKTVMAEESDSEKAAAKKARQTEPESETFQPDPSDALMQEFSAAVDMRRAPKPDSENGMKAEAFPDPEALAAHVRELEQSGALGEMPVFAPDDEAETDASSEALSAVDIDVADAAESGETAAKASAFDENDVGADTHPLDETMDTDKMLSEVASLANVESVDDALDESLDTDKLLAEVGDLQSANAAPTATEATQSAAPSLQVSEAAPSETVAVNGISGEISEDDENGAAQDVLSEFKDVTEPSGKTGT